jgi:phosphoribosylglycinamide formyltransferase 1
VITAQAQGLERAKNHGISAVTVSSQRLNREDHELKVIEVLKQHHVDWVCLCGYKRIVTETFLQHFPLKDTPFFQVLNIHPALCPAFPGLHAYERAYNQGVKISGVTVHLVDSGMDTGPVILQEAFRRNDHDSLEQFINRGMSLEYQLYPQALELIGHGRLYPHKKGLSWYVSTEHTT